MLGLTTPKKGTVEVDVTNEVDSIMKLMVEYSDDLSLLNVEKKIISEANYNHIWSAVTDKIIDTTTKFGEEEGLSQNATFQLALKKTKLANRLINNLYTVDWVY